MEGGTEISVVLVTRTRRSPLPVARGIAGQMLNLRLIEVTTMKFQLFRWNLQDNVMCMRLDDCRRLMLNVDTGLEQ